MIPVPEDKTALGALMSNARYRKGVSPYIHCGTCQHHRGHMKKCARGLFVQRGYMKCDQFETMSETRREAYDVYLSTN